MKPKKSLLPQEIEKTKELLRKTIEKKRKLLLLAAEKAELLKMDIGAIEEEYNYRVGRLYLKDNLLDLEIIRYKKINELMDCGLTFDEAVLELEENLQKEKEKLEQEEEKWDDYFDVANLEERSEDFLKNIRALWKKLVHKYHPDLITDTDEKKKREDLMKKINKAYTESDYETLKTLQEKELVEPVEDTTVENLEKIIIDMENAITRAHETQKNLKKSQWYAWLKKTNIEKEKLIREMERNIISDIVKKQLILDTLKRKHNNL